MTSFREELRIQRWDDHRYYHHSRINQTLHFVSATTFVTAYVMLFVNPAISGLLAWLVAMTTRQAGHFFFEPKDYDVVNQATHEHKEDIKVGYNLHRKVVLMAIWALSPLVLLLDPAVREMLAQPAIAYVTLAEKVGWLWLAVGVGGLLFRTLHLFHLRDARTGLVWATKIVTDPFHDIKLYHRAPIYLLRGELIDPMNHGNRA